MDCQSTGQGIDSTVEAGRPKRPEADGHPQTGREGQVAMETPGWGAYQPIDVLLGEDGDMSKKANGERVKNTVRTLKPDLTVITPPCGPWCAWQRLCQDWDNLDEIRRRHLPFWKLAREIWDIQQQEGRLCLTEQFWVRKLWRQSIWWSGTLCTGWKLISACLG